MGNADLDFFKSLLMEASDDDNPPPEDSVPDDPPPLPEESDPPADSGDAGGDMPPGMDDSGMGDMFGDDGSANGENNPEQDMKLNEKISAILNQMLYQKYLKLVSDISGKIAMIKDNTDVLYAISTDCADILEVFTQLDTNLRLYLKNHFPYEDFSKNRLFFNKCLNLTSLIDDSFDTIVKKGLRKVDT